MYCAEFIGYIHCQLRQIALSTWMRSGDPGHVAWLGGNVGQHRIYMRDRWCPWYTICVRALFVTLPALEGLLTLACATRTIIHAPEPSAREVSSWPNQQSTGPTDMAKSMTWRYCSLAPSHRNSGSSIWHKIWQEGSLGNHSWTWATMLEWGWHWFRKNKSPCRDLNKDRLIGGSVNTS